MNVGRLALRNLRRRPSRTALLAASIALAVATALALLALSRGIQNSVQESISERGSDLTVSQRNASDVFSGFIDETIIPKVKAVPGVEGVSGELVMFTPVEGDRDTLTFGWAPDSYNWRQVPLSAGSVPPPGTRGFVLVGSRLAQALGRKPGDMLSVFGKDFSVAGVTAYKTAVNRNALVIPLADLQDLAFRAGQVTVLQVLLEARTSQAGADTIAAAIEELGDVRVDPTETRLADDRNLAILDAVSMAISIIALVMAGISVLNVLLMSVQERMRETGIMMAIGWSSGRIMATIVAEGAIIGLIGCLAGVPIGFVACALFNELPAIGSFISFTPTLGVVAPSVGAGLVLSVLGSLYPAWRAVSRTPADALRRA